MTKGKLRVRLCPRAGILPLCNTVRKPLAPTDVIVIIVLSAPELGTMFLLLRGCGVTVLTTMQWTQTYAVSTTPISGKKLRALQYDQSLCRSAKW